MVQPEGLLDEVLHIRRIRGAAIVRTADGPRVLALLKELGAEVHARTVERTREDRVVLNACAVAPAESPR